MEPVYRLQVNGEPRWGWKRGDVYELIAGDPTVDGWSGLRATVERAPVSGTPLLAPCGRSKVLALAYNYRSLTGGAADQEPLFFFKSVTGLVGSGQRVRLPDFAERVWVEVELTLVIGKGGANIPQERAHEYILGHTIGNDITAVNLYGRDHHLARSKGLDGFCPVGPCLIPGMPPDGLAIETHINGRLSQSGNTADRILGDAASVATLSRYVTLEPGDIILTGTCAGAMESLVRPGDTVVVSIDGIGRLETTFID